MASLRFPSRIPLPEVDAEELHKGFTGKNITLSNEGSGTNEMMITSVLAHRNAKQRSLIRAAYAANYNKDLLKELDTELSGDYERAVMLWTLEPAERDAYLAKESTKMFTKDNWVLVEIACTRSSLEFFKAKQAYQARYKTSIEEDVAYHTSGDVQKLLVPLVSTFRYDGDEVNMTIAKSEANILQEKLKAKVYNDGDLIRILTTRSKSQINATLNHFKDKFGTSITNYLKEDSDNQYVQLLRAVIKCLTYPVQYFEKVLHQAINKVGTDELGLTRVITTRTEFDMERIKEEYLFRNSVPLDRAIANDTHGDYKDFLLALLGHYHA